jgi:hypothetical protein
MGTNELHPHFVVVMIKFMTNILIIKDICEIIINNLVNFFYYYYKLDPKTWATLLFKFIIYTFIHLLYII